LADAFYDLIRDAKHPAIRMALNYWLKQRERAERKLPGRQHIDPLDMTDFLPYVVLFDVVRSGVHCRFRHRLTGTHFNAIFGRDVTGMFVEHTGSIETFNDVYARFSTVTDDKVAAYGIAPSVVKEGGCCYEHLTLPLAADGETVDMLFGVRCLLTAEDVPPTIGYATAPLLGGA
jgi:hypothetical protein